MINFQPTEHETNASAYVISMGFCWDCFKATIIDDGTGPISSGRVLKKCNTYGNKMIQVTVCGRCEFQSTETNVVQGFVVNAECLVRIFHQLMNR